MLVDDPRGRSLGAVAGLVLVLALLGVWVPSADRRRGPKGDAADVSVEAERTDSSGMVRAISLPDMWPAIPDGPNRAQFQALCRLCHSPRLVLTQPRFPEKKWAEVVHKMVAVYGAPIPPEEERAIVQYLTVVRGTER